MTTQNAWWYKILTSPEAWEFMFTIGIVLYILFKFKLITVMYSFLTIFGNVLFKSLIGFYCFVILSIYWCKSGVNMVEYFKGIKYTYKGIKCTHVSGVDTIVIDHPGIFKPFALLFFYLKKLDNRLRAILNIDN